MNCIEEHKKEVKLDLQKLSVDICSTSGFFDFVCKIQSDETESIKKKVQDIRKIQYIKVQIQYIQFQNKNN
jgi:hypothetical protein